MELKKIEYTIIKVIWTAKGKITEKSGAGKKVQKFNRGIWNEPQLLQIK